MPDSRWKLDEASIAANSFFQHAAGSDTNNSLRANRAVTLVSSDSGYGGNAVPVIPVPMNDGVVMSIGGLNDDGVMGASYYDVMFKALAPSGTFSQQAPATYIPFSYTDNSGGAIFGSYWIPQTQQFTCGIWYIYYQTWYQGTSISATPNKWYRCTGPVVHSNGLPGTMTVRELDGTVVGWVSHDSVSTGAIPQNVGTITLGFGSPSQEYAGAWQQSDQRLGTSGVLDDIRINKTAAPTREAAVLASYNVGKIGV